ncbi:MAG: phosphoenolpyruvate carboxykinase (GTP) [Armatimonadota bacterium]|nr:MAG: phosphoenolpyruvate carboxykinase (GTP) [Armatimonadota bacterium]
MARKKTQLDVGELARALYHYHNVEHLSDAAAKDRALQFGQLTEFGSYNFVSSVRNRSAGLTVYLGSKKVLQPDLSPRQREILDQAPETLRKLQRYLDRTRLICIERTMGNNTTFCPHCTMYVSVYSKYAAQLAYMWGETLFAYRPTAPGPDMHWICVPEWPEQNRQILVFPEQGVTFVLGSDYMGEAKKGFLRMAMWYAKQEGMLGVHAGAKMVQARQPDGKMHRYSILLFGLSATGKTTHSCHDHGLSQDGETMDVVQDDVCFLRKDGSALGTERGFYLKTEGLDPHGQPLLYNAAIQPNTIFENVMVDSEGNIDFQDETLTSNGRGVVQMANFAPHASDTIDLPPADETDGLLLFFITRRNTVLPMVSRLTPEQGALAFMLGESVESSAGDPRRAGESVRVVGTNPFIVGDEAAEGNWVLGFFRKHPNVQCYLINTGGVGEVREKQKDGTFRVKREVMRIQIPETSALFRAAVRGTVKWTKEPHFGLEVPEEIEGVDIRKFDPSAFYSTAEVERLVNDLKRERREYVEQFTGLDPAIVKAAED